MDYSNEKHEEPNFTRSQAWQSTLLASLHVSLKCLGKIVGMASIGRLLANRTVDHPDGLAEDEVNLI
jgi:hypothetical protein